MTETAIVLVDARNVLRSRWPNIPEVELVSLACTWARRHRLEAVLVFDGRAPEAPEGPCRSVGTGRESADDWITRAAAGYAGEGRRYWLVTSDRALRAAAGEAAERVVGGGSFANQLVGGVDESRG